MKKLALIGMIVAGLLLSTSTAWAKPTGMTPAEYQALTVRSEGLNHKYGLDKVTPSDVNQKLEEIGAWAVPSKQSVSTPLVSEKLSGLDLQPTSTATSGGNGFDWNDAGIGAALALAGVLGIGAVLTVRHQHQHKPILH
jgi:opacity protein-like surface antigen